MTSSFSIADHADNIYNERTKEYFKEVQSSFENGNYRSAVVMLYSVVICDLIYKLQELRDIHHDDIARKILEDVEKKQEDKMKSAWEEYLIEQVELRSSMFTSSEINHITQLRNFRHLSAHPVMNNQYELYSPNIETTMSQIRNVMESILTRNPVISKKLFPTMLKDLASKKDYLTLDGDLAEYVNSRYLKSFNQEVYNHVLKSLWDITFRCPAAECIENRDLNYRLLKLLIQFNTDWFKKLLEKDSDFLSHHIGDEDLVRMKIIDLICEYDFIYEGLESHAQTVLKRFAEKNKAKDKDVLLEVKAYFISPTLKDHFAMLDKKYHSSNYQYNNAPFCLDHILTISEKRFLHALATRKGRAELFNSFIIRHFGHSTNYVTSAHIFDNIINGYLKDFSEANIIELMYWIDNNPQINGARDCDYQCRTIKEVAEKKGYTINYEKSPNFKSLDD